MALSPNTMPTIYVFNFSTHSLGVTLPRDERPQVPAGLHKLAGDAVRLHLTGRGRNFAGRAGAILQVLGTALAEVVVTSPQALTIICYLTAAKTHLINYRTHTSRASVSVCVCRFVSLSCDTLPPQHLITHTAPPHSTHQTLHCSNFSSSSMASSEFFHSKNCKASMTQ